MNIVILGPPGSGKGTQSRNIVKHFNFQYISAGDLLRSYNNQESIKKTIGSGNLLDDTFVTNIVGRRIKDLQSQKKILLDGFPRTLEQAFLIKSIININCVIELVVPDNVIIKRILGRLIHERSGRTYHSVFKPPQIPNFDDITGEKLTYREDDTPETIKKRIQQHYKNINSIINFYQVSLYLRGGIYLQVDAARQPHEVFEEIKNMLKNINALKKTNEISR